MMTPSLRTAIAATPSQPFATPANPYATPAINPLSTPQYTTSQRGHWPGATPGGGSSSSGRTPQQMGSSSGGRTPQMGSGGGGRTPQMRNHSASDWANMAAQWAKGGKSAASAAPRDRRSPRGPPGQSPYSHGGRDVGQSPYSGGGGSSDKYHHQQYSRNTPGQSPYGGGGGGGGGGRYTPGTPRAGRTPAQHARTPGTPHHRTLRDPRDGGSTPLWDEA